MTTVVTQPMDGWKAINRKQIRHNVFKLQKRIYQASIGTTDNCRMIEEPCEVETLKHGFAAERRERSRRLGIISPGTPNSFLGNGPIGRFEWTG